MCTVTAVVTASGSASELAWLEAVARVLTVAAPIAVGAVRAAAAARSSASAGCSSPRAASGSSRTLANADDSTLYSIGRVAQLDVRAAADLPAAGVPDRPARQPLRPGAGLDRGRARASSSTCRRRCWSSAYPVPSHVASCDAGCPGNAFMVSGSEPGVIEDLVRPLREFITIALFAAVAVRLALRIRGATRLMRRALAPVLAVACFRCAVFAASLLGRRLAPESGVVDVSVWLLALAVPLTAVAFLVGPRALVGVHRALDPAARGEAARSPHPRGSAARARRGVRRSVAGDRVLAGQRRGTLGRRGRAPARSARGRARSRRDGDRRRRAPGRGDRPRRRAGGRPRVHRHGDLVRADDARQPPPVGADVLAAARGARVARAHPGRGGRRAPAHRARPARRRAAAARRAAHQAGAGRRADRRRARERRRGRRRAAPARRRRRGRRSRRSARWRAASIPRRSPIAGSSRGCARRRCATRFRRRSSRPASGATRARSRAPRTSAAWRRSRTPRSTRRARAPR